MKDSGVGVSLVVFGRVCGVKMCFIILFTFWSLYFCLNSEKCQTKGNMWDICKKWTAQVVVTKM